MNLRAIMLAGSSALFAVAAGTPSALDIYNTTSASHGTSGTMPHLRSVQFDDNDDGVGGCVNECKLKLEICLGQRPDGEPRIGVRSLKMIARTLVIIPGLTPVTIPRFVSVQ